MIPRRRNNNLRNNVESTPVTMNGKITDKSVRFSEDTKISVDPLSWNERKRLWYNPRELLESKNEVRRTLTLFWRSNGDANVLNPDKYCLRGLERFTTVSGIAPKDAKNRQSLVREVLKLQDAQRKQNRYNPLEVHVLSSLYSTKARQQAISNAEKDEEESMQIIADAICTKQKRRVLARASI